MWLKGRIIICDYDYDYDYEETRPGPMLCCIVCIFSYKKIISRYCKHVLKK
jgi:hypothetical protein